MFDSGEFIKFYWCGCSILGLTYMIFFEYHSDAIAFIVSQVAMGVIGIYREYRIEFYRDKNYEKQ